MNHSLEEIKNKYALSIIDKTKPYRYDYTNSKCVVSFFVSDIQMLKWDFYDPKATKKFIYKPWFYLEFVLNMKRPKMIFDKSINNLEGMIREYFTNFNRKILDYMELPMAGDFSWHESYIAKLKQLYIYSEFAYSVKSTESEEKRNVARMYRRKEDGWEEAIKSCFSKHYPDGGKEFAVDEIFTLFPD